MKSVNPSLFDIAHAELADVPEGLDLDAAVAGFTVDLFSGLDHPEHQVVARHVLFNFVCEALETMELAERFYQELDQMAGAGR